MQPPTRSAFALVALTLLALLGCDASDLGVPPQSALDVKLSRPSVGRQAMTEDPHYLEREHLERVLSTPLRVTPSRRSDELAARFASTMADRTDRCAIRRIVHRQGSNEVFVDLGLGCSQGSGVLRARFERQGEMHVGHFEFEDFWLSGNKLDGTWEVAAFADDLAPEGGTHLVAFRGEPPFEEVPAQALPGRSGWPAVRLNAGESLVLGFLELTLKSLEAIGGFAR